MAQQRDIFEPVGNSKRAKSALFHFRPSPPGCRRTDLFERGRRFRAPAGRRPTKGEIPALSLLLRLTAVAVVFAVAVAVSDASDVHAAVNPIVTAINVRGNAHTASDKILAVVRSRVGAPLDPKQIAADQAAINALGWFSDVKADVRSSPGGVSLNFVVIENPVVQKIQFGGNAHVTGDILTALMDTSAGSVLNVNTLRDDVQKINNYYDKLGYTGIRHVQNIKISPDGTLALTVTEGVTVKQIKVTGNTIVSTPAILATMKTKAGTTFSEQTFNDDLGSINQLYKDIGFSASIDGNADPNNPGVVNVSICEAKVGAVEIQGNGKTRDYVIRRLLRLRPGEFISDPRLRRDYEAINNTQYFKSVDLSTKPFQDKCGYLTLVWTVIEQRTGTAGVNISYGGGGQYGTGLSGGLSFSESNINGTGNGAQVSVERGNHVSNITLGVSIPYIHKFKPDSLTFNVFNNVTSNQPEPVYKEPGNNPFFSLSPVSSSIFSAGPAPGVLGSCIAGSTPCTNQFANYSSRQAGISIGFGHPVADYTRLNLGIAATRLSQTFVAQGFPQQFLDLRSTIVQANQTGPFSQFNSSSGASVAQSGNAQIGIQNVRTVSAGLFRDNRDDVRDPRYGGTSSFSIEASGKVLGSDYGFTKSDLDYTRFLPVKHHSTLGLHLNYGFSSGGQTLPYNSLFRLDDQTLRGTKFVFFGDREILGQAELRIPVTSDRKFGVVLFADAGDTPYINPLPGPTPAPTPTPPAGPHAPPFQGPVQPINYQKAPFRLKSDIGIGLRVQTPILPQIIRIDFASGQGGTHVSFGLGQAF